MKSAEKLPKHCNRVRKVIIELLKFVYDTLLNKNMSFAQVKTDHYEITPTLSGQGLRITEFQKLREPVYLPHQYYVILHRFACKIKSENKYLILCLDARIRFAPRIRLLKIVKCNVTFKTIFIQIFTVDAFL